MKMPELNKKNTTMLVGGLTLAFIMWLFFSCSSVEDIAKLWVIDKDGNNSGMLYNWPELEE